MKGIVFTEFLEMIEEKFGYEMVDEILLMKPLESNGIYSSVGTYPHSEMVTLVSNLHEKTKIPLSILLETFGEYLFFSLYRIYGENFKKIDSAFSLIENIENYIHVEVKKLYPEAELPSFKILEKTEKKLIMEYSSERSMGDLAVGLMRGCFKFFNENATINKENLNKIGSLVKFSIQKIESGK